MGAPIGGPAPEVPFEVKKTPITRHFDTGAVRGEDRGRGKPSLLPFGALRFVSEAFDGWAGLPWRAVVEISKIFEAGSIKYQPRNWEKGIPLDAFVDSAIRHLDKYLRGELDEPHCGQFAWNLVCLLQTHLWIASSVLPKTLDTLGTVTEETSVRLSEICCENSKNGYVAYALDNLSVYLANKDVCYLANAVAGALCLVEWDIEGRQPEKTEPSFV